MVGFTLKGQKALVTGSTKGIGLGIARVLAGYGCDVVVNGSRDANTAADVMAQLTKEFPQQKFFYAQANLQDPKAAAQLVHTANKLLNGLNIVVNNAGVQHVNPIEKFPLEQWNRLIAINLTAPFVIMKETVALWKKAAATNKTRASGRIVNISSVHGVVASKNKAAYIAAKHGLNGLMKVVALETAADTDITVNSICPGWVDTPLVRKQIIAMSKERSISEDEAIIQLVSEKQPRAKFTSVEQVGEYTAFLCSPYGANITGAMQIIDGGWSTK